MVIPLLLLIVLNIFHLCLLPSKLTITALIQAHIIPPRIFQSLPLPISLGCVENHLPERAIYQANAVSSPPTVPYSLKSDLLEKSIQGLPATSCFSHNLPCSLSSLTLDPPRTSLTHNADPCNCLYTFTWLKGNSLPCPNSMPGKHLRHPSGLSLRITSQ